MQERFTKTVRCPAHLDHKAVLYTQGSKFAGIWECPVDFTTDSCEHAETHTEEVEVDTMHNGEHDTYVREIEVCDLCEVTVNE